MDPTEASPDLVYICDHEEIWDLKWRRVRVNILDLFEEEVLGEDTLDEETPEEAAVRWAAVRSWMNDRGGSDAALHESPVLLIQRGAETEFVDGWHRCVVAYTDYGARTVEALLGTDPAAEPDDAEFRI